MATGAGVRGKASGLDNDNLVEAGDDKDDLDASDDEEREKEKKATKMENAENSRRETMITNPAMNKTGVAATQPARRPAKAPKKAGKSRPASANKTRGAKASGKDKQDQKQPTMTSSLNNSYKRQESQNLTSTSPTGRKGKTKKKAKDLIFEVSEDVNAEADVPYRYLTDRLTMQQLVTRATQLKQDTAPPQFVPVSPWIKKDNNDVEFLLDAPDGLLNKRDRISEWFYQKHMEAKSLKQQ